MSGTPIEKRIAAGPLLPKWNKVKSKHKALKSSAFTPDISSAISRYDDTLKQYDELQKDQDKLKDVVNDLMKENQEAFKQIQDLTSDLTDITKKSFDTMSKSASKLQKYTASKNGDSKGVVSDLSEISDAAEDFLTKRKSHWDQIDKIANQNLQRHKKARDEFKSKSDAVNSKMDKLEDAAYKAQTEIAGIVAGYVQIADEMDHPEIIKDLQALGKEFG